MPEVDRTSPPEPGDVRHFEFPRVVRDELPSGFGVLSARHGRLPLVTASLVLDAGAERERPGEAGLARLTAAALETGTGELSADDLAWELERIGIELDVDVDWDAAALSVTVPSERLDSALQLLSAIVRSPSFPEGEIRRLRDEQLADLLQRRKEPRALANDMSARFIFEDESTYARTLYGTAATVGAFDRDRVLAFHRRTYAPDAATLILVGDIDEEHALRLARSHFGDWGGTAAEPPGLRVSPGVERNTVFVVDRPGAVQSEIRIGHVGLARSHPDYFPLLVMNTILGGAFTSRLNMSLRETHGFTYGAHSVFDMRRHPGPFVVQAAVATDVTAPAVREAVHEMQTLAREGASEEEVANARDYLAGVLPLRFQTTGQLASRLADLVVYDLPPDHFARYQERIRAVTPADVRRVAAEQIGVDRLAIVVVGDAGEIEQPLCELGLGDVEVHHAD